MRSPDDLLTLREGPEDLLLVEVTLRVRLPRDQDFTPIVRAAFEAGLPMDFRLCDSNELRFSAQTEKELDALFNLLRRFGFNIEVP